MTVRLFCNHLSRSNTTSFRCVIVLSAFPQIIGLAWKTLRTIFKAGYGLGPLIETVNRSKCPPVYFAV